MSITKYKLIFGTANEFHNVLWQTLRHYMTDAVVKTKTDIHVFPLGRLGQNGSWFEFDSRIYTAHLLRPGIHPTVLPRPKPLLGPIVATSHTGHMQQYEFKCQINS